MIYTKTAQQLQATGLEMFAKGMDNLHQGLQKEGGAKNRQFQEGVVQTVAGVRTWFMGMMSDSEAMSELEREERKLRHGNIPPILPGKTRMLVLCPTCQNRFIVDIDTSLGQSTPLPDHGISPGQACPKSGERGRDLGITTTANDGHFLRAMQILEQAAAAPPSPPVKKEAPASPAA